MSFVKRFECCGTKTRSKISDRQFQMRGAAEEKDMSPHSIKTYMYLAMSNRELLIVGAYKLCKKGLL